MKSLAAGRVCTAACGTAVRVPTSSRHHHASIVHSTLAARLRRSTDLSQGISLGGCAPSHGLRAPRRSSVVVRADAQADRAEAHFSAQTARLKSLGVPTYKLGTRFLTEGSHGEDVRELQRYLQATGHFTSEYGATGYYGQATRKSVEDWQTDVGMPASGSFGEESRDHYVKLQEELGQELKRSPGLSYGTAMQKVLERRRGKGASPPWKGQGWGRQGEANTSTSAAPPGAGLQLPGRTGLVAAGVVALVALAVVLQRQASARRAERELEEQLAADRLRQASRWTSAIASDRAGGPTPPPKADDDEGEGGEEAAAEEDKP